MLRARSFASRIRPVGAFVLVRRLPVRSGVVLGPLRHVSVLFVFQFLPVLLVTPLSLDVIALGAGRLKGLDVFLERDRDRELFELAPNKEISDGSPD